MAPWNTTGNTTTATDFLGTNNGEPLVVKTGGVEQLRVDTNGRVGIGTSSPGSALHLAAGKALRVEGGTGPIDSTSYFSFGGHGTFGIDAPGVPNGRFVVTNVGQVGIGMSNPAYSLQLALGYGLRIEGGDNSDRDRDTSTSTLFSFGGMGVFGIDAPGVPNGRFVVENEGNVGVGTNAPNAKLDVRGQASFQGPLAINNSSATPGLGQPATDPRAAVTFGATDTPQAYYLGAYTSAPRAGTPLGVYSYQVQQWSQLWQPDGSVQFTGNVAVTGDVLLTGADCAEEFDLRGAQLIDVGTVMVIDEGGTLRESSDPYDRKVAGVVSGGGEFKHGLILDKRLSHEPRVPLALMGKVYCKVDAQYSPIHVGDLLTTSPTPGHAMKAADPSKSFGSVIGKALKGLDSGQGLIPILVTLQ